MVQELLLKKIIHFGVALLYNHKTIRFSFGKSITYINHYCILLTYTVYSGDTGYSPELFKAIGELYAPFTLAAIPIGSFMPTQLMKHLHMGPEDAIKAHIDLGFPRMSVGIHWATFMMSDEFYLAPKQILDSIWSDTAASAENSSSKFITTAFGQTIVL